MRVRREFAYQCHKLVQAIRRPSQGQGRGHDVDTLFMGRGEPADHVLPLRNVFEGKQGRIEHVTQTSGALIGRATVQQAKEAHGLGIEIEIVPLLVGQWPGRSRRQNLRRAHCGV